MQPKFLHDVFFLQSQEARSKFHFKAKPQTTASFSRLKMLLEWELGFWQGAKGLLTISYCK